MRRTIVAVVLVVPLLAACSKEVNRPSSLPPGGGLAGGAALPSQNQLIGLPWQLLSLELSGRDPIEIPDALDFTVEFGSDGTVHFGADCNGCFGSYATEAGTLTIGEVGCTRAFCSSSPLDTDYLSLLSGSSTYAVSADTLRVASLRGTLRFER